MEGIMNYVEHNRDLVENEAMEVFNNIKSKDMALAEAAKQAKRPYRSYIKKPVEGVQRGTEAHLENFLKHVQKGCYEDPLPVKEMNLPSKKELENRELKLPPKLIRLRGTNICEITNKHFNWIGEHITRQSTDVTHAKALLFVFRHNQNWDTKVQHLTGVLPKTLDWYIREALQSEVEDIVVNPLGNENFPPDFDRDQHMEPVGKHYQLYSMWGHITQEIDKLMKKRDVSILLSKQDSNDKPASGSYALVSNNTAASSTDDKAFVVDSDGIGHGNSSVETSPVAKLPRRNANTDNAEDIITYPLANMPSAEYSGCEVVMKPIHDAFGSVGNVDLPPPQAKRPRSDSGIRDASVPSFGAQV
jgi:hypothetical protein